MDVLEGKVAVVTGGAGGIGAALARRFGQEQMKVVLADVLEGRLHETVRQLRSEGFEVTGVVTDVTDFASVERLAGDAVSAYGAVHVVCNNAGVGAVSEGYMWEHDLADWRWGIDVNVLGVVHGIRAFVPLLVDQDEGHVVNSCSGNGSFAPIARGALGGPANAVYPMTKAAVLCLTESLYSHLQMAGSKVGVSALFPGGFLNTGIWESWRHRPDRYAESQKRRTPHQTLDAVVQRFESAGATVSFTPLEQVAETTVKGIRAGSFWMIDDPTKGEEVVALKARSIKSRGAPDYLADVVAAAAARPNEGRAEEASPREARPRKEVDR